MSRSKTPEGKESSESEPIFPKTGLDLIKRAVGENPIQWIKITMERRYGDLELVIVGNNGIWGKFQKDYFLTPTEPSKQFLEEVGAVKTEVHLGTDWWDLRYPTKLARKLKELRGEEAILLFLDTGTFDFGTLVYEVPTKNIDGLIAEADKQGGKYSLSAELVTFGFSVEEGRFALEQYTVPWGAIKIGEAVPRIEVALENSRRLEAFLVANQGVFK
ncbi:MAG: hypothetical protein ACOZBZ_02395 [Patescibacteria group bacterium]